MLQTNSYVDNIYKIFSRNSAESNNKYLQVMQNHVGTLDDAAIYAMYDIDRFLTLLILVITIHKNKADVKYETFLKQTKYMKDYNEKVAYAFNAYTNY